MIQVAMVQTLSKRKLPFIPALFVVDEAHITPAPSFKPIFDQALEAKRLLVSATPERGDGEGFLEVADKLIIGATVSELIAQGYLVPPRYLPGKGNSLESYLAYAKGKKAIVFTDAIWRAKAIANSFKKAGIKAEAVHSGLKVKERDNILDAFTAGNLDVLINVDVVSEGFDFPALEAIIHTHTSKNATQYFQKTGRVLRPYPGKTEGIIIDHGSNKVLYGPVEKDRPYTLEGRPKKPLYLQEVEAIRRDKPELCASIRSAFEKCQESARRKHGKDNKEKIEQSAWGMLVAYHCSITEAVAALGNEWLETWMVKNYYRPTHEPKPEANSKGTKYSLPTSSPTNLPEVKIKSFRYTEKNSSIYGYVDVTFPPFENITHSQQSVILSNGTLRVNLRHSPQITNAFTKEDYEHAAVVALDEYLKASA
jgi:superfamily II DNA/RNA helicase